MNLTNYVASKNIEKDLIRIEYGIYSMRFWYFISLLLLALSASLLSGCGHAETSTEYLDGFKNKELTDIDYVRIERDKQEISAGLKKRGYKQKDYIISAYYINDYVGDDNKLVGETACFKKEHLCVIIVTRQWMDALAHELIHALVKEDTHDHTQHDLWAGDEKDTYPLNTSLEYHMYHWEIDNHNTEVDFK